MLQSLLKNLRKVIITYFYLLPSSVQAVLHLLLQFILLKITVSYSFLETDLNLMLCWVFCYFHQLFLSFIRVSTSGLSVYLFLLSLFQKIDSFYCFPDYDAQPLPPHQFYFPFSIPVLSVYLTICIFFITFYLLIIRNNF